MSGISKVTPETTCQTFMCFAMFGFVLVTLWVISWYVSSHGKAFGFTGPLWGKLVLVVKSRAPIQYKDVVLPV